ncbi:hypothetical protein Fot_02384 [Forsythia ovata]|uniref:Uncharacterized protein n=1 Tax=Forsythia ovata TaxID=205694 RepID=A0ABD1XAQ9_9LAMI
MAKVRENHTQQWYNHGGHANAKSSNDNTHRQTRRHQETRQRPFPETGSSYAAEITQTIPNLYTSLHAPNQGIAVGQTGPSKSKNPSIGTYCAHHQFYGHSTEDFCGIHALAEQITQKKDHASFGGSRSRNNSLF